MVTSALTPTTWVFLGFLGLLVLERFAELALSNRNARRAFAKGGREVGQAHYRVMTTLHTLFFFSCLAEVLLLRPTPPFALVVGAYAVALLAQALRYWAIATLGERWNTRIIFVPDLAPVTGGPYRFMRHPNYLAVIVELAVVPLAGGAWVTALVFSLANAVLLTVRIRAEEAALGEAYQAAFVGKRRFVPGQTP